MQTRGSAATTQAVPARPAMPPIARTSAATLQFQYVGRTGMTVVSPTTGKQYRFDRTGAIQQIDPRDRQWMERVPNVRPMRRAG